MPRIRPFLVLALSSALAGCGSMTEVGPPAYTHSPKLKTDLKGQPKLQAKVVKLMEGLFGPNPAEIHLPMDSGLPENGARLAKNVVVVDPLGELPEPKEGEPQTLSVPLAEEQPEPLARGEVSGYELYREHCLHCHGASGDGDGPTAPFLWPLPRDYRQGIFKFTSTSGTGPDSKPTRDDLRRTLIEGIPDTSMPSFQALMTKEEMERVIDYVIFLSMRGETERNLVYLAQDFDDESVDDFTLDLASEAVSLVFSRWQAADSNVLNPQEPRPEPTLASILRGRKLYLGQKGLQCFGCHGVRGDGQGESFIDLKTFNQYVFHGDPGEGLEQLEEIADERQKKWSDDWGNPLRPADLTEDRYKGGRRPIDLYWRIAKGINGTPMPAHLGSQLQTDQEVWDLVNFVLALPYEPELLKDARPYVAPGAEVTTRAGASPKPVSGG